MNKRTYDSTVARIAGNILSGLRPSVDPFRDVDAVRWAVEIARAIVAQVERTEPKPETGTTPPAARDDDKEPT